jgi:hypothetical protein
MTCTKQVQVPLNPVSILRKIWLDKGLENLYTDYLDISIPVAKSIYDQIKLDTSNNNYL